MNARLERKLRLLAVVVVAGTIAGLAINFAHGPHLAFLDGRRDSIRAADHASRCGIIELFVLDGPLRDWLSDLSFTANLMVRSAIYAAIIMVIQLFQSGEVIAGLPLETSSTAFLARLYLLRRDLGFDESGLSGSPTSSGRAPS